MPLEAFVLRETRMRGTLASGPEISGNKTHTEYETRSFVARPPNRVFHTGVLYLAIMKNFVDIVTNANTHSDTIPKLAIMKRETERERSGPGGMGRGEQE